METSKDLVVSENRAVDAPQAWIDDEFYKVIVPNYEVSYKDEAAENAAEPEASDQGESTSEKLSFRKRVAKKLGAFATEIKIALAAGMAYERENSTPTKRKVGAAALVLTGLAAAGAFAAHKSGLDHTTLLSAYQNADMQPDTFGVSETVNSKILTPGMGDGTGQGIANQLRGTYYAGDKPHVIQYPASAAPLSGTETFDQSIEKGSDALYNAIKERLDQGYNVDVTAYSQGTVVQKDAMDRIIADNGGVVPEGLNATYLASPNVSTGLYNNSIFQMVEPALNQLGANLDHTPLHEGAHVIARETDVVSNSADRPWTTALSQAVGYAAGDGHALTAEDIADTSRHFTHTTPDGVTITSVRPEGTQTAALRAAEMNGFLVTPEADAFGQAIAPQGHVGMPNPNINGDEVIRTGAALIDDSVRRAGMADPNLSQAANDWVNHAPEPVKQAVNDTLNAVFNPQPAPAAPEPSPAYVAPVVEAPTPMYEPAPVYTPEPAYQAPVPAYTAPAEQAASTINAVSDAAQSAANTWAPGNTQIQNDIQNLTDQAQGLASQFGLVR